MKFDVCVGNPPYQEGIQTNKHVNQKKARTGRLYEQFFYKLFNNADCYGIVLPAGWLGKPGKLRNTIMNDAHVEYIIDTTNAFTIALSTCAIIKNKLYNSSEIKCISDTTTIVNKQMFTTFNALKYQSILAKTKMFTSMNNLWCNDQTISRSSNIYSDVGVKRVITIVGNKQNVLPVILLTDTDLIDKQLHVDMFKVVMNYNASLTAIGNIKVVEPGYYVTGNVIYFPAATVSVARNIEQYLNTSIVKFITRACRSSVVNSKVFFKHIPLMDFTRLWTDQELYQYFNLTQDEINLIESTIK